MRKELCTTTLHGSHRSNEGNVFQAVLSCISKCISKVLNHFLLWISLTFVHYLYDWFSSELYLAWCLLLHFLSPLTGWDPVSDQGRIKCKSSAIGTPSCNIAAETQKYLNSNKNLGNSVTDKMHVIHHNNGIWLAVNSFSFQLTSLLSI